MLAFSTIEFLLQNERSVIRVAVRKNAAEVFKMYINLMNNMANNTSFDIKKAAFTQVNVGNNFMDETILHFNDLITFDVKNIIEEAKMVQ